MAQRTKVVLTDDLTGEELEGGQTVKFGLDGTDYEIDLGKENADGLREAFKKYVHAARRISGGSRRSSNSGRSTEDHTDAKAIRAWAAENGVELSARGRIPANVLERYNAAH